MAHKQLVKRIDWPFIGICCVYLFLTFLTWNVIEEDAFIYVRVAENIADGFGYVFNRGGERIETGSATLWQLLVVVLHWIPLHVVTGVKLLEVGVSLLSLFLTRELSNRFIDHRIARLWPSLLLSVSVPFVYWGQAGLANPLYICLLLWTVLWIVTPERSRLAWLPASLLLFGRPESPLFAFLLLGLMSREKNRWRMSWRSLVIVLGVAIAAELARFLYFHDLVSQPFYRKMLAGRGDPLEHLWHHLVSSNRLVVLLPLLAVAWRRAFWSRERAALAVAGGSLLAWAAIAQSPMPFSRHFVPTLPFLFVLSVTALEDAARKLESHRQKVMVLGLATMLVAVAIVPRVPTDRLDTSPNPLYAGLVAFAEQPARYAAAIGSKLTSPSSRTFLDEPSISPNAIEQNWQALIGKFIAANYAPDVYVIYDQMGQTPYYAGSATTFIDSFGLTDRATAFVAFNRRVRNSPILGLYDALASALVGFVFPGEDRHPKPAAVLDSMFAAGPEVVMVNRYARSTGPVSLTRLLTEPALARRGFVRRYTLVGFVDLYERRGHAKAPPIIPPGLLVQIHSAPEQRSPRPSGQSFGPSR